MESLWAAHIFGCSTLLTVKTTGHDGCCPLLRCVFCQRSRDPPRNVFSAMKNKVLMGLTEGGMQHLMAGARASVGVKTGRCLAKLQRESFG